MKDSDTLILFYDGQCPLCVKEMRQLQQRDKCQRLILVDIYSSGFQQQYPEMQDKPVLRLLHGYLNTVTSSGAVQRTLITGLDVTYHAWRCVGKGWLIKPLRWPIIRFVADACYLVFAKHRFTLSYWLTGQKRCQTCMMDEKQ